MKELFVVANKIEAKIFSKKSGRLSLLKTLENKKGRKREREFHTDKPGQSFAKLASNMAPHSLDVRSHHTDVVRREFAHKIALFLKKHRQEFPFERLVLVAEPHFLGDLNGAIGKVVKHVTTQTVGRSMVKSPAEEILSVVRARSSRSADQKN